MLLIDHLFIALLFVVQPIHGYREYRRVVADAKAGQAVDRIAIYRETGTILWVALAVLLATWMLASRDFTDLGIQMPAGQGFWWSLLLCTGILGFLAVSARSLRNLADEQRERYVGQVGDLGLFLPATRRELRNFYGLSATAGVVEEIVYRGFVLWYLAAFMPVWAAILLSSLAFGLGHSYQGLQGIWRTAAIGAAFAVLYVASGSIWLPIVAHALFDVVQGAQAYQIFRERKTPAPA